MWGSQYRDKYTSLGDPTVNVQNYGGTGKSFTCFGDMVPECQKNTAHLLGSQADWSA